MPLPMRPIVVAPKLNCSIDDDPSGADFGAVKKARWPVNDQLTIALFNTALYFVTEVTAREVSNKCASSFNKSPHVVVTTAILLLNVAPSETGGTARLALCKTLVHVKMPTDRLSEMSVAVSTKLCLA